MQGLLDPEQMMRRGAASNILPLPHRAPNLCTPFVLHMLAPSRGLIDARLHDHGT